MPGDGRRSRFHPLRPGGRRDPRTLRGAAYPRVDGSGAGGPAAPQPHATRWGRPAHPGGLWPGERRALRAGYAATTAVVPA